jgi:hypothetical protein
MVKRIIGEMAMTLEIERMTLISINTKNDTETVNVMKKLEAHLRKQKNAEGWLEYKYHQMCETFCTLSKFSVIEPTEMYLIYPTDKL